jgi:peptidoglycan/LPS O-acetylase OafA/YrhL
VLVLATVIGRTFLSSLALDRFYESFPSFLLYFPLFHLPKFLFGMALGKFFTERRPPAMVCVALFWASALTLLALFVARPLLPTWIFNDAILSPLHACLIVGAAGGGAPRLLELPFLVLLGEASYAIYILHAPLEFYWHALATSSLSVVPATLSYCLFVVAFALLAHRFIERPLRRSLIKVLGR